MSFLQTISENQETRLLIILIGTFIVTLLSYILLRIYIQKITGRKKKYGIYILKQLTKPVLALYIVSGLYLSFKSLSPETIFTINTKYIEWIDVIAYIAIVLLIALLVSRIFTILLGSWLKEKRGFERPPILISKVITIIIFVIAFVMMLANFEIDVTPIVATLGLASLGVGLALQSTLSNFFAGIHIISDRPIDVGNYIEIDENTKGIVEDVGWRSTRIRTLTDNLLVIPNNKLAESNITNFSKPKQDMAIWVPCGVAYESDLEKVEKITLEVAKEIQKNTNGAVKDFEPLFRYREFGDSNINFITVLRVEQAKVRFAVRNEFIKTLKKRFDKEKIEISWPIRKIYNIK